MKTYNNTAGTTSSEFEIGVGSTSVRQIVLGAICNEANVIAADRSGNQIQINGVEFVDMKVIGKDIDGNILTKQFRGTMSQIGSINLVEDTFDEGFNGSVSIAIANGVLSITCAKGSATSATFSIYISLQRVE